MPVQVILQFLSVAATECFLKPGTLKAKCCYQIAFEGLVRVGIYLENNRAVYVEV